MTGPVRVERRAEPSRLARIASRAVEALRSALSRFPFAVLAIGLLALFANLEIADIRLFDRSYDIRVIASLGAGAALSVAVALFGESVATFAARRVLAAAAAGGLAASALVWFGWEGLLFAPPFLTAALLAIPLAPHLVGSNGARFWTFTLWSSFGVALGFASVLVFVAGVSAILEMVRYLFGIGLSGDAYEHIYVTAMLFVGPLFALGRIPRDFDEDGSVDQADRFTAGVAMMQTWVAMPLVLAAAAVLHLYVAKILATGEVPKNQIGWIVGFYALSVLSLRVLAAPFLTTGVGLRRLFARVWMPILVIPIALLVYAVFVRVASEGFTTERYYLALAALAATLVLFAQALAPIRGDIRWMAAIPVALLAVSSVGPWGAAATVARSQLALIKAEFATGPNGVIDPHGESEERRSILRSRIAALAEVDALPTLRPMMSSEASAAVDASGFAEPDQSVYITALGLEYGAASPAYVSFSSSKPASFDVSGFDLVQTNLAANEGSALDANESDPAAVIRDGRITLRLRGLTDEIDPAAIGDRFAQGVVGTEPLQIDLKTDSGRSVRLRVNAFSRLEGASVPVSIAFDIAFRAVEWQPVTPLLGGDGNR